MSSRVHVNEYEELNTQSKERNRLLMESLGIEWGFVSALMLGVRSLMLLLSFVDFLLAAGFTNCKSSFSSSCKFEPRFPRDDSKAGVLIRNIWFCVGIFSGVLKRNLIWLGVLLLQLMQKNIWVRKCVQASINSFVLVGNNSTVSSRCADRCGRLSGRQCA